MTRALGKSLRDEEGAGRKFVSAAPTKLTPKQLVRQM